MNCANTYNFIVIVLCITQSPQLIGVLIQSNVISSDTAKHFKKGTERIKSWNDQTIGVQDKGSRFVILENSDCEYKIKYQIERSSFKQLPQDPSKQFEMKVNNWIEK